MENNFSRREFLSRVGYTTGGIMALLSDPFDIGLFRGIAQAGVVSNVYYAKNGSPTENIDKLFEIMGGMGNFLGAIFGGVIGFFLWRSRA